MKLFSMMIVVAGFPHLDGLPQFIDFTLLSLDSRLLLFELGEIADGDQ
jgi:hypothetical protein